MINYLYTIGIVIGIILLCYVIIASNTNIYETYINIDRNLHCLSKEEGQIFFQTSGYFSHFKPIDYQTKDCPPDMEQCKNNYLAKIYSITKKEKELLIRLLKLIKSKLPLGKRNKFLLGGLKFIKGKEIEAGLPHTHKDVIILDQSFFDNLDRKFPDQIESILKIQGTIMIHEITHLKQRVPSEQKNIENLFREWEFKAINIQKLKSLLGENYYRIRLNPDELPEYQFWEYNGYVPLVLFRSARSTNLQDVDYLALDLKTQRLVPYESIPGYMNYFQIKHNNYHPKEIMAEYMSHLFLEEIGMDDPGFNRTSQGYLTFKKINF